MDFDKYINKLEYPRMPQKHGLVKRQVLSKHVSTLPYWSNTKMTWRGGEKSGQLTVTSNAG